jgi:hypothetical protein
MCGRSPASSNISYLLFLYACTIDVEMIQILVWMWRRVASPFVLLHYILLSASSVSEMVAVSALSKLRISYVVVLYKLSISSVYALCKLCSMSESESGRISFAGGFIPIPIPIPDGRQLAFDIYIYIYCHDMGQHVRTACAVARQLPVRSRIYSFCQHVRSAPK